MDGYIMKKLNLSNAIERNFYGASEALVKAMTEQGYKFEYDEEYGKYTLYTNDGADRGVVKNLENAFIEDGFVYDLEKACEYMDDEEREHIHSLVAPCSGQEFWEEFKSEYPDSVDEVMNCLY